MRGDESKGGLQKLLMWRVKEPKTAISLVKQRFHSLTRGARSPSLSGMTLLKIDLALIVLLPRVLLNLDYVAIPAVTVGSNTVNSGIHRRWLR